MTRDFYRFVRTHPRTGKNKRSIAFLEGRYAAPFNGFICDVEQTPEYSVWGLFGNSDSAWGHGQPEKCRQLLDVLMPGSKHASAAPALRPPPFLLFRHALRGFRRSSGGGGKRIFQSV